MKKIITLIVFAVIVKLSIAQSVTPFLVSSAGGYSVSGSYSLHYAVGEIAIETIGSSPNFLTQGFIQPYYLNTKTSVDNLQVDDYNIDVYPNPVKRELWIAAKNIKLNTYQIFDICGKEISNGTYTTDFIDFSTFNKGVYFLKFLDFNNKPVKALRVVKVN